MQFGLYNILQLAGAVGIFIYGMKLMSESVQRAAGDRFRAAIDYITKNKWMGFMTGFLITALVQSSSATTVMTVSLVNAGLFTATESVGLILGANVGTTVTGWIVSLFGFKVNLGMYALPIMAVGVPMIFISYGKTKDWGEFLIGFAMIFFGLGFMREAMPLPTDYVQAFDWLKEFTNNGIWSRIFFVVVGALITVLVQSSSVAMAITLTMCAQGWLPAEIAASLILGENIGTTSTALIASIVANREAKISARIHFMFNLIGVAWMVVILPWFLPLLSALLMYMFGIDDIYSNALDMTLGLSAFHTVFNLINAFIFINATEWITQMASYTIRGDQGTKSPDKYAATNFLKNAELFPEIAIIQIQKETQNFGNVLTIIAELFHTIVNTTDDKKQMKLINKLKQYEELTDRLEITITEHITLLSKKEVSNETNQFFKAAVRACNDMERVADLYAQLAKTMQNKIENNIYFLPEQRDRINEILFLISESLVTLSENLSVIDFKNIDKYKANKVYKELKRYITDIKTQHHLQLGTPAYNLKSAMVYSSVFQTLELVNNHIFNVTESLIYEG